MFGLTRCRYIDEFPRPVSKASDAFALADFGQLIVSIVSVSGPRSSCIDFLDEVIARIVLVMHIAAISGVLANSAAEIVIHIGRFSQIGRDDSSKPAA